MLTRGLHVAIVHWQRVKFDYFDYFKGKIVPGVSLGCPVVQGNGYLNGEIGSLPFKNSPNCVIRLYYIYFYFIFFILKYMTWRMDRGDVEWFQYVQYEYLPIIYVPF